MPKFKLIARYIIVLSIVILVSGCLAVPKEMQVRSGASPSYQDDNVRFRTTYYFRVISICDDGKVNTDTSKLDIDSLYRFRMTGKAGALANKIHFESGFLPKSAIDPFGSVVSYDSENNRFHVSSHEDIQRISKQKERLNEQAREQKFLLEQRASKRKILIDEINNYLRIMGADSFEETDKDGLMATSLTALIKGNVDTITALNGSLSTEARHDDAEIIKKIGELADALKSHKLETDKIIQAINDKVSKDKQDKSICTTNSNQYGFQVLGPQGMRTYDQDQRLLLSMSTSAKPLVATLKELATRMMPRPTNNTEALLQVTEERLTLSRTERELFRLEDEISRIDNLKDFKKSPADFVENILNVLNENEAGGVNTVEPK